MKSRHPGDNSFVSARQDAFTFYTMTSISYLESAVGSYVENLIPIYKDDTTVIRWLTDTWLPEETLHGRISKEYVTDTWPEFDWQAGYRHFLAVYSPAGDREHLQPTPALEALARCVTETQTAMVYRCIGSYTADTQLQTLMRRMSADEVGHYRFFRDTFDRYNLIEQRGLIRKSLTLLKRSRLVRDKDLASAFAPLNHHWLSPPPFLTTNYEGFLVKAGSVMNRYFPFENAAKMLFKPLRDNTWMSSGVLAVLDRIVRRQYPAMT